jgi:hypothetical protein
MDITFRVQTVSDTETTVMFSGPKIVTITSGNGDYVVEIDGEEVGFETLGQAVGGIVQSAVDAV